MELIGILLDISKYGTAPALLVIVAILGLQNRHMAETKKEQKAEIDGLKLSLRTQLQDAIAAIAKQQDERHKEHEEAIADLEQRMGCVERESVTRDEHYRDFSGWREEIRHVCDRIDNISITLMGLLGKEMTK